MSNIPTTLKYTATHEWVNDNGNGVAIVGITDHAQALLGDVVFVELPELNKSVTVGQECGVVESVKAAADVYAPITGQIIEVNTALTSAPELINQEPYGDGWLYKIRISDANTMKQLLDADAYSQTLDQ